MPMAWAMAISTGVAGMPARRAANPAIASVVVNSSTSAGRISAAARDPSGSGRSGPAARTAERPSARPLSRHASHEAPTSTPSTERPKPRARASIARAKATGAVARASAKPFSEARSPNSSLASRPSMAGATHRVPVVNSFAHGAESSSGLTTSTGAAERPRAAATTPQMFPIPAWAAGRRSQASMSAFRRRSNCSASDRRSSLATVASIVHPHSARGRWLQPRSLPCWRRWRAGRTTRRAASNARRLADEAGEPSRQPGIRVRRQSSDEIFDEDRLAPGRGLGGPAHDPPAATSAADEGRFRPGASNVEEE